MSTSTASNDVLNRYPALTLGAFGVVSGSLGTQFLSVGFGTAPDPGVYMVPAGIWFSLVIAFAVWTWGRAELGAAAVAALFTWVAWELAVNVALILDAPRLADTAMPVILRPHVSGFVAGAVGALVTWSGVALFSSAMRDVTAAAKLAFTGAALGLLLQSTNYFDSPAVLLIPWQAAIAALIGHLLARGEPAEQAAYSI